MIERPGRVVKRSPGTFQRRGPRRGKCDLPVICANLHISSIRADAAPAYTGPVLIKEVAMDSSKNAVSMSEVESQAAESPMRRHLAAVLMIGAVVAATGFAAP